MSDLLEQWHQPRLVQPLTNALLRAPVAVLHSPAEALALAILLLLVSALQALERLDVLDGFKCFVEIVHNVSNERLDVLLMKGMIGKRKKR